MFTRIRPHLTLAGVLIALLATAGVAHAAAPLKFTASEKVTLSPARVAQLVAGGARVEVPRDVGLHPLDVRLYVNERVLRRGGHISVARGLGRFFISGVGHLRPTRPGPVFITLHVEPRYRASLLHAGRLTLGVLAVGY